MLNTLRTTPLYAVIEANGRRLKVKEGETLRLDRSADDADEVVLVAAVWVNPDADDEEAVYENNAAATLAALTAGRDDLPSIRTVLDVSEPRNPYFRA